MECDKTNIGRQDLIDRYLLDQLSVKESDEFEEHLFHCKICRQALSEQKEVIEDLQNYWAQETFRTSGGRSGKQRSRIPLYLYITAAAGIALVAGLFILQDRYPPTGPTVQKAEEVSEDRTGADTDPEIKDLTVQESDELRTSSLSASELEKLSEYKPHPLYESLVGVHTRSANLVVEEPADSIGCMRGSSIEFIFQAAISDSLFLILMDNKGDVIVEDRIASPHQLIMEHSRGLYYWQLSNEDEALYTGKIILQPD